MSESEGKFASDDSGSDTAEQSEGERKRGLKRKLEDGSTKDIVKVRINSNVLSTNIGFEVGERATSVPFSFTSSLTNWGSVSCNNSQEETFGNDELQSTYCITLTTSTSVPNENYVEHFMVNSYEATKRGGSLISDLAYAAYATQGSRPEMEDMYILEGFKNALSGTDYDSSQKETQIVSKDYAFFAIFDGHGGIDAASYASSHLHQNISKSKDFLSNPVAAIREGFLQTELDFEEECNQKNIHGGVGTTVCAALIVDHMLYIANLGDSAAVLCRSGKGIPLANQHCLRNEKEKERISKVGGVIKGTRLGHPLWNPGLIHIGVTRAIGDYYFKQDQWTHGKPSGLIADAEITVTPITTEDSFLILASDGFWDVVDPQRSVELVKAMEGESLQDICKSLIQHALNGTKNLDNATVLLVKLKN